VHEMCAELKTECRCINVVFHGVVVKKGREDGGGEAIFVLNPRAEKHELETVSSLRREREKIFRAFPWLF